jgi:hypothetical protein
MRANVVKKQRTNQPGEQQLASVHGRLLGCHPRKTVELNFSFQIDTARYHFKSVAIHRLQRFALSVNLMPVI